MRKFPADRVTPAEIGFRALTVAVGYVIIVLSNRWSDESWLRATLSGAMTMGVFMVILVFARIRELRRSSRV